MICVDASVVFKWYFVEELSEQAVALGRDTVRAGESLVAPPLLLMELTNTIRQRTRRSLLTAEESRLAMDYFLGLPLQMTGGPNTTTGRLHHHALALAIQFNLPAVYDAYYLAFAEQNDCPFWTADRRLVERLGGGFPLIRWIGDFTASA